MNSTETDDWKSRTRLLAGETGTEKLARAHVLVAGLGGVGAYAAECLCRAGIGEMTIVDADTIKPSNINRQLIALHSNVGQLKAEAVARRLADINPQLRLHVVAEFIKDQKTEDLLTASHYDFVVDAIDSVSPKVYLLYHCNRLGIKAVSSMGAGGKRRPEMVQTGDISQTHGCKLAKVIRKRLKDLGVERGIRTVFSPEEVARETIVLVNDEPNKRSTLGTISFMPAIFGCFCAAEVLNSLIDQL